MAGTSRAGTGRRGRRAPVPFALFCLLPVLARPAAGAAPAASPGRTVHRTPGADRLRLEYRWTDPAGATREIGLSIPRRELEESERELGFSPAELRDFLIAAEIEIRDKLGLTAVDIARSVVAAEGDPGWCRVGDDRTSELNFVLRTETGGQPGHEAEVRKVLRLCRKRWEASRKRIGPALERKLRAYAGDHGMEVTAEGLAVDYKRLVRASAARLRPLAEEFRRVCGPSRQRQLEAVLSFVQNIPRRAFPPLDGGRYTAGLAVPLRVLSEDAGDCDSKAVLFASLWLSLCRHRIVLVQVPEHMLVAVAAPWAEGATIELHSERLVLLELNCGPDVPPGKISAYSADHIGGRDFRYKIVS